MAEETPEFALYKLAIADEHHYRAMLQSRISFHSGVVLALMGVTGAGVIRAEDSFHFLMLALLSLLFAWIARYSVDAIKRIYIHFLEAIHTREQLETQMGLREDKQYAVLPAQTDKNTFWPYRPLYDESWLGDRAFPDHKGGYFDKTAALFKTLSGIGFAGFILFLAISASLLIDNLATDPTIKPQTPVEQAEDPENCQA